MRGEFWQRSSGRWAAGTVDDARIDDADFAGERVLNQDHIVEDLRKFADEVSAVSDRHSTARWHTGGIAEMSNVDVGKRGLTDGRERRVGAEGGAEQNVLRLGQPEYQLHGGALGWLKRDVGSVGENGEVGRRAGGGNEPGADRENPAQRSELCDRDRKLRHGQRGGRRVFIHQGRAGLFVSG